MKALHTYLASALATMLDNQGFETVGIEWSPNDADPHNVRCLHRVTDYPANVLVAADNLTANINGNKIAIYLREVSKTAELDFRALSGLAACLDQASSYISFGINSDQIRIQQTAESAQLSTPYGTEALEKILSLAKRAEQAGHPLKREHIQLMLEDLHEPCSVIMRSYLESIGATQDQIADWTGSKAQNSVLRSLERNLCADECSTAEHAVVYTQQDIDSLIPARTCNISTDSEDYKSFLAESSLLADAADEFAALIPLSAFYAFKIRQPMRLVLLFRRLKDNRVMFSAFLARDDEEIEDSDGAEVLWPCIDTTRDAFAGEEVLDDEEDSEDEFDGDALDLIPIQLTELPPSDSDRNYVVSQYLSGLLLGHAHGSQHCDMMRLNRSNISQARYRTGIIIRILNTVAAKDIEK